MRSQFGITGLGLEDHVSLWFKHFVEKGAKRVDNLSESININLNGIIHL